MMHHDSSPAESRSPVPDENQRALILSQLARIQNSHAFGNSARAKEFLAYAVKHAIEGHVELLKERSIGVNLFHRDPVYVTSDDPIVRVKAAEVRKRLTQYYAEEERTPELRIELPVGSYIPRFHWGASTNSKPTVGEATVRQEDTLQPARHRRKVVVWATVVLGMLGMALTGIVFTHTHQKSPFEAFWAPVLSARQPVLICLPSPVAYAISSSLFLKAGQAHPGLYDTEVERSNTPLELAPDTPLEWKDVTPLDNYFVNKDDAYVAADLSELFGSIHKESQVRIGPDFTYEDLRNSPAVLIGAFDNPWTIRVAPKLPFFFREQDNAIVERGGKGRVWRRVGEKNRGEKDFAVLARLLNSKTGQFLVVAGGIGMVGTQAAGHLISHQGDLDAALQASPRGWQNKNLEIVIESDVVDASASPPRVVAVTTW
jgi:hypothetical protein